MLVFPFGQQVRQKRQSKVGSEMTKNRSVQPLLHSLSIFLTFFRTLHMYVHTLNYIRRNERQVPFRSQQNSRSVLSSGGREEQHSPARSLCRVSISLNDFSSPREIGETRPSLFLPPFQRGRGEAALLVTTSNNDKRTEEGEGGGGEWILCYMGFCFCCVCATLAGGCWSPCWQF